MITMSMFPIYSKLESIQFLINNYSTNFKNNKMAKMLYDKMSSVVHLSYANRHARLCKRTKGAEGLSDAIQAPMINLKGKCENRLRYEEDKSAAYDDMQLSDALLDDVIRNLSDGAKQYDRANPGRSVHTVLFPDGKTTSITQASLINEPNLAMQVLQRIKSLPEGHELLEYETALENAIDACRASISSYQNSITDVKTAIAEEEMAQADLRKQYEFNYLDAIKMFGKNYANRLFPKASSKKQEIITEVLEE